MNFLQIFVGENIIMNDLSEAINAQKSKPLINLLVKLGNWPLITPNWKYEKSPKEVEKLALKRAYTRTLSGFYVVRNPENITNYVIGVNCSFYNIFVFTCY